MAICSESPRHVSQRIPTRAVEERAFGLQNACRDECRPRHAVGRGVSRREDRRGTQSRAIELKVETPDPQTARRVAATTHRCTVEPSVTPARGERQRLDELLGPPAHSTSGSAARCPPGLESRGHSLAGPRYCLATFPHPNERPARVASVGLGRGRDGLFVGSAGGPNRPSSLADSRVSRWRPVKRLP